MQRRVARRVLQRIRIYRELVHRPVGAIGKLTPKHIAEQRPASGDVRMSPCTGYSISETSAPQPTHVMKRKTPLRRGAFRFAYAVCLLQGPLTLSPARNIDVVRLNIRSSPRPRQRQNRVARRIALIHKKVITARFDRSRSNGSCD